MSEPKYELVITGDENDADYVTSVNEITEEKLQELLPVIEVIRTEALRRKQEVIDGGQQQFFSFHNWPTDHHVDDIASPQKLYPSLTPEQIEAFETFLPMSNTGIHTVTRIAYYPITEKTTLLEKSDSNGWLNVQSA